MGFQFCHSETISKISLGHCGPLTPFLQFRHLSGGISPSQISWFLVTIFLEITFLICGLAFPQLDRSMQPFTATVLHFFNAFPPSSPRQVRFLDFLLTVFLRITFLICCLAFLSLLLLIAGYNSALLTQFFFTVIFTFAHFGVASNCAMCMFLDFQVRLRWPTTGYAPNMSGMNKNIIKQWIITCPDKASPSDSRVW